MLKPTRLTSLVHKIEDNHAYRDKYGRIHYTVLLATPKETKELHHITQNFADGSGVEQKRKHLTTRQRNFCRYVADGVNPKFAYSKAFESGYHQASYPAKCLLNRNNVKRLIHYLKLRKQAKESVRA